MAIPFALVVFLVPLAVILAVGLRVLNLVWFRPKKLERCLREQGLSGEPYRLFGDSKERARKMMEVFSRPINLSDDIVPRVSHEMLECIQKYGKNCFMWRGPTPVVLITNPDEIKHVLAKYREFQKLPTNPLTKFITAGLVGLEGDVWTTHRRILNPAFHPEKLKNMLPAFRLSCNEILDKWGSLVSKEGSCELDICSDIEVLTSNSIARTAFGTSFEEGKRIFQLLAELTELTMKAFTQVYFPGRQFLPTKFNKRIKEVDREVSVLIEELIRQRLREMEAGKVADYNLLSLMLESNAKEINSSNQGKNFPLTMEDIIEECKVFHNAGKETTLSMLVWTMIVLSQHQEWQERARDEVLQVFGKEEPTFDGLNRLKIVTMILNEVLRLYPPAIAAIRTVPKDTTLGTLCLPAGVQISMPMLFIQRENELWGDDAKEFKPERFSEGVSQATKGRVSFFPFGWGPRICIGQGFSMMEAKLVIAMILQQFRFELSPSYAHAPMVIMILQPQFGAHIILRKL